MTTVGSGDCFLAGYVAARYENASPKECLAFGVACGAESTQHFGAGTLDRREVERLLPRVAGARARRARRGRLTRPARRARGLTAVIIAKASRGALKRARR